MTPNVEEHIGVVSKEDCDWIKSLCSEFTPSEVTYTKDKNDPNIDTTFRSSKTCRVVLSEKDGDRLLSLIKFLGVESLPEKNGVQLLEYVEGDFFKRHVDGLGRYRTILIQLSDKEDYGGGELYVEDRLMSKESGSIVMFDSHTFHQLDTVTSGKRHVLVIWLLREHFTNKE